MAMHIEQPGSRHSAPASRKMRCSPSASACRLTACEPGTTSVRTPAATRRPSKMRAACAQIADAPVGAGADEHHVDLADRGAACPARAPCSASAFARVGGGARASGTGRVDGHALARVGAAGDHRLERAARRASTDASKRAPSSAGSVRQRGPPRPSRRAAARARGRCEILEGRVVGRDHAGARARLDRHVADGHARLHVERADRRAGVLDDVRRCRRRRRCCAMIARIRSLAVTPARQRAVDAHLQRRRAPLQQALRGQHVLDLAGADAEGERAEGAVGGGVAVAADDGHARLREPELGPDDVHDAAAVRRARRAARASRDAELARSSVVERLRELAAAPAGRRCGRASPRAAPASSASSGPWWRRSCRGGARRGRARAGRRTPAAR